MKTFQKEGPVKLINAVIVIKEKTGNSIDDCSSAITLQVESVRREDVLRDLRRKFDGLLYELKLSEEHVINIDDS